MLPPPPPALSPREAARGRFARALPEAVDLAIEHAGPDLHPDDVLAVLEAELAWRRSVALGPVGGASGRRSSSPPGRGAP